jgi:hypothetical protein
VLVRRELLYVSALALVPLSSVVNARPSLAPLIKQAHHITQRPTIIGSLGQAYSESPTPLQPWRVELHQFHLVEKARNGKLIIQVGELAAGTEINGGFRFSECRYYWNHKAAAKSALQALCGRIGTKFHQGKPGIRADTSPDRLASHSSVAEVSGITGTLSYVLCGAVLGRAGCLRGASH